MRKDGRTDDASCVSEMTKNFSESRELLLSSLSNYYNNAHTIERVLPVIAGNSHTVSLRLLDWFVTNYAKTFNVHVPRSPQNGGGHVNVYLSYRAQLKAFSKQHFDPFRRRNRLIYYYTPEDFVETTIGQLNFFRWILQNDVLEYVTAHAPKIEEDMLNMKTLRRKVSSKGGNGDKKGVDDAADDGGEEEKEDDEGREEKEDEEKEGEKEEGKQRHATPKVERPSSIPLLVHHIRSRDVDEHVVCFD